MSGKVDLAVRLFSNNSCTDDNFQQELDHISIGSWKWIPWQEGGSLGYLDRYDDHIHLSGQLDLVDGGFATFYAHVGEAMVGYQGLRISATPELLRNKKLYFVVWMYSVFCKMKDGVVVISREFPQKMTPAEYLQVFAV